MTSSPPLAIGENRINARVDLNNVYFMRGVGTCLLQGVTQLRIGAGVARVADREGLAPGWDGPFLQAFDQQDDRRSALAFPGSRLAHPPLDHFPPPASQHTDTYGSKVRGAALRLGVGLGLKPVAQANPGMINQGRGVHKKIVIGPRLRA